MDKSERETHDFMNVESFSQLPFIRPTPPLKEKGIRLFGKEFGGGAEFATAASAATGDDSESAETTTNPMDDPKQDNNENNGGDCGRRFECHYCCRNFPTSQALGGHQNAHKRERQHAKRAHLQSAMVHTATSSFSSADPHAHMYGALMNFRHQYGSPPTTRYYGSQYGSFSHNHNHHHQQPLINGNPLGLWRIPTAAAAHATMPPTTTTTTFHNRDRLMHHNTPMFSGDEMMMKPSYGVHGGGGTGSGGSSSQSSRYIYESKPSVQDHVSLDLHL